MLSHPKTTVVGYLTLAIVILTNVVAILKGNWAGVDMQSVLGALAGVGLVVASDGGH